MTGSIDPENSTPAEHVQAPVAETIPAQTEGQVAEEDDIPLPPNYSVPDEEAPEFGNLPDEDKYTEPKVESTLINPLDTRKANANNAQTRGLPPLSILYGTLAGTVDLLNSQVDDARIDDPKAQAAWVEAVEEAYPNYFRTANGRAPFEESVTARGEWGQGIEINSVRYAGRSQRLPVESGERLVGADALARVTRAVGMGAIIQIPCWHSGIWVSIKAPGDVELYELERRIAMEKVALGRMTKGLVFSNTSVYIAGHLINFILSHLYSSTAPTDDPATIKKILKTQDLPTLIWGMVTAIYPGGYPYRQPCMTDITKCTHIVEALLDIGKLQWVDRSMLSDKQKAIMTQRSARTTQATIDEYQSEFGLRVGANVAKLNEQMTIEFGSPTIEMYENSGYSWVEAIVSATDSQFGNNLTGKERSDYISDVARTTAPRQYSHWVKAIEVTDEKGITTRIEDRASIEACTVQIASVDDVKRTFIKAVGAFIDATTVCVIGYLNYACPKCGELQMKANGPKSRIIPIDMMQVFLTLQRHKIDQALREENAI